MGMFDWVDREPMLCPRCGAEVKEFQTKSGENQLGQYSEEELVSISDKYDCTYWGYCENCSRCTIYAEYVPAHWKFEDYETKEEIK